MGVRLKTVGVVVALGLGAMAMLLTIRTPEKTSEHDVAVLVEPDGGRQLQARHRPLSAASTPDPRPSLIQSEGEEVTRSDLEWDAFTDKTRVQKLQQEFSTAIDTLESGEASAGDLQRAEGALSNLRSELYATAQGRREHQALEMKLSAITDTEQEATQ